MSKLTIADIAKRAGVCKATVSRVLNDRPEGVSRETRARIRAILDETGFQPSSMARSLATGHSRSVGLIIPSVSNPFHPLLVSGAERALSDAGYSLFLCNTDSNGDKQGAYVRALIEKGVDGVILDSVGFQAEQQVALLEREGIPVVLLDCVVGHRSQRFGVFLDNAHGVREALTFLFHRPDRRLVFISGPDDVSQSVDRRQGVAAFAAARQLGPDRLSIVDGDFSLDCGFRVACALLNVCRPGQALPFNGIFAANDMMALGALKALRQAGVGVPGEVEVMGFDDIEFVSLFDPPLSTVAQPARDMGAASALLLLRLMSDEKPRRKTVVMKPRLVLRGTTLAQHPPKSGETDGEL